MSGNSDLPSGWQRAQLSVLAELLNGDRGKNYPSKGAFVPDGTPFINAGHLQNGRIDYSSMNFITDERFKLLGGGKVQANDILYCLRGSLGKTAFVPDIDRAAIASSLVIIRPHLAELAQYLNYFLVSPFGHAEILKYDNGTAQPNLSARNVKSYSVPLGPLAEQRRIVAKIEELFSDLDAGVAALERAKANLKRYRSSVLKAAVEGRLTAQWRAEHPDVEPAGDLLARILKERRQRWEADQLATFAAKGKQPPKGWQDKYKPPAVPNVGKLPELPPGWCWATIDQLCFIDVGFAFKSAEFVQEGIRLLRGDNLEPGRFRWTDARHWPEARLEGFEHLLVSSGEIILAMDRPLISSGLKIARATVADVPCLLVQRMARFCMVESAMTGFVFVATRTHSFIKHLLGGQTGTQLPHISGTGIASFAFPIPPLDEQLAIENEVDRRLSVIESIDKEIDADRVRAVRLRQSILKRAFEGKLVPQDPRDEPAGELLARIQAQRAAGDGAPAGPRKKKRAAKSKQPK